MLPRLLLLSSVSLTLAAHARADAEYREIVAPFLEKHCMNCHDADTARAGFRMDTLGGDFTAGNNAGLWKEVMDRINSGEMPPKKKARPEAKESFAVVSWIAQQLAETTKRAQGAGGRVPLRRLNRVEYANTVSDLFSLDPQYARRIEKELPADGQVGGFDRGAAALFMDEGQLAQYMAVADMLLDEAVFMEQPQTQKLAWDAVREKWIHGIGVSWKDGTGKVVDDNPTPEFIASLKEPLARIQVDDNNEANAAAHRYVPHGPMAFAVKNGGVEYLSGGNNYRSHDNQRSVFHQHDWAKKGVTRDGWYRLRFKAGAFAGEGGEKQKEVKLVMEYCYGSPIQVVKGVVIDAPLEAPKDYEILVYLEQGPPGMDRSWNLAWDNGNKDVVIENPAFQAVQWAPVLAAGDIEKALLEKKPADQIAALRKKSEAALAAAARNRKNFAGPLWIYDPELDPAKRPRLWMGPMEWEGPLMEWPPQGRTALLPEVAERSDVEYVREVFRRFLPRAYRRPALEEEVESVAQWTLLSKNERQLSLEQAVREGVKNVLCSPAFLYLGGERGSGDGVKAKTADQQPLDPWQLASRLSYLLWSGPPDDRLRALAADGKLGAAAVLREEVKRMIADPKAGEFVRSFAGQWLSVRNFDNGTPPNRDVYGHYDDALRESSRREPLEFFSEVLRRDLPATSFLESDFLVINERLAKHYGIEGVTGDDFRRVATPADGRRGGVLGMAGILTFLADGSRTLPVRRAVWVLDALWNQPVPPPPPNAGNLPAIKEKNLSVRSRLDQHRLSENCASCHDRVDPFGLALENYDATGHWRDRQNGEGMSGNDDDPALDVSGQLSGGRNFATVQEFKARLLDEKKFFIKGFTEKLLCYALGRPINYGDYPVVEQITTHAAQHEYRLQEIIQATVASPFFTSK
ncbi:MAG: hypothetical protein JWM59_2508 [Verrucomicrobiales bacterium]|nr:hypothetical protein [Verrucomicrobiales bacterium]